MSPQNSKPQWGRLYAVFLLMFGLLVVEHQLPLAAGGHQAAQLGVVLLTFSLVHFWLRANMVALMQLDQAAGRQMIAVTKYPPALSPAADARDTRWSEEPQLTEPALRGPLGDQFECESADHTLIDVSLN